MVDAIVREWVRILWDEHCSGFEDVWQLLAAFYADDGLVVARNPEHLQLAFDVLITLFDRVVFDRVGLKTNTTKTESMIFLPGRIRTPLTVEAYEARMVDTFREEKAGRKVTCPLYPDVSWQRGPSGPTWPPSMMPTSTTSSMTHSRGPFCHPHDTTPPSRWRTVSDGARSPTVRKGGRGTGVAMYNNARHALYNFIN